jgi:hypothetical protein
MPKQIKGDPRRKPPEPTTDHSAVHAWFTEVMPPLQPIVRSIDDSVRAAVPNLQYGVKFHRAFYGLPELGWIIEIAPYFKSVNILFLGGAELDPPPPLGSTGRTRYIKVSTVEAAQHPDIRLWMEQAGRTLGWT